MMHLYPTRQPQALAAALLGMLALAAGPAAAQQLNYNANNAQNLAGTYQDLGTTGTVIPTANFDDANSAPQPIGFPFPYNGATVQPTSFILSTNGFIKLGTDPLSDPFLFYVYAQTESVQGNIVFPGGVISSTDPRSANVLVPFGTDLMAGSGGNTEYRVATTGTAPNRVCTIQWKNVKDKPKQASSSNTAIIGTQYDNFSFQVKLYETTGQIDFVYGPVTAGPGPDAFRTVEVGIKGNTPQAGDVVMADKNSTGLWANAVFRGDNYVAGDPHNIRSTVRPDLGRTYRFRASAATDAAVQAVYTLGQLPVGTPHAVKASIRNVGTQPLVNLPVSLSVSGQNTFTNTQTIGNLAPGATTVVTFAAYTAATRLGTNTVTVRVPQDAFPQSDMNSDVQQLTANTFGYVAPPGVTTRTPGTFGFDTRAGIAAVKFTAPRATTVTAVTNFVPTGSNSAGQAIYGVLLDPAGNILATTPDRVLQAADLNTTITLSFATPVAVGSGDFMVGIAQRAGTVAHFPVANYGENPVRTGAFFDRLGLTSGGYRDLSTAGFGPLGIGAVIFNTVTGTKAAATQLAFSLAPNPATGRAQLSLAAPASASQAVQVFDALGRVVRTGMLAPNATQATLDVADLPRGVYVVRLGSSAQRLVLE